MGAQLGLGARQVDVQVIQRVLLDGAAQAAEGVGVGVVAGQHLRALLVAGLAAGLLFGRMVETLLFGVKATDTLMLASPIVVMMLVALIAALPAAIRAVRTDPAQTLRSE